LKHYISNRRAHERAQKRGGGVAPVPLELDEAETRFRAEPAGGETPESALERQWAPVLLAQVFAEIRVEWEARGKVAEFDRLKPLLLDEAAPGGFAAAARNLGTTDSALRMASTRLRRRFRQVLRDSIAETTADEDIEAELRFLLRVLFR
jgi:hypothetical protein